MLPRTVLFAAATTIVLLGSAVAAPTTPGNGRCSASRIAGDFDGDSRRDTATVFESAGRTPACDYERMRGEWRLAVTVGGGGRRSKVLSATGNGWKVPECNISCRILGAPDLDHDGRDELAVQIWNGASTIGVGVFRAGRSRVLRLRERGATEPMTFTDAGSLCCWSAVRCWGRNRVAAINGSF